MTRRARVTGDEHFRETSHPHASGDKRASLGRRSGVARASRERRSDVDWASIGVARAVPGPAVAQASLWRLARFAGASGREGSGVARVSVAQLSPSGGASGARWTNTSGKRPAPRPRGTTGGSSGVVRASLGFRKHVDRPSPLPWSASAPWLAQVPWSLPLPWPAPIPWFAPPSMACADRTAFVDPTDGARRCDATRPMACADATPDADRAACAARDRCPAPTS